MLLARGSLKLVVNNVCKYNAAPAVNLLHTSPVTWAKKKKFCGPDKVAVVMAGCGGMDGTEISEAISVAIHLSAKGLEPHFFAPCVDICGVVNHLTNEPEESCVPRNALVEAARIARGRIRPLCECSSCSMKGLVFPGGFGCVRTLSDFAAKGCNCAVLPDIDRIIKEFACDCKPIAAICIAPLLVVKVLNGCKITLGKDKPCEQWPYADTIEAAKKMGAQIEMKDVKSFTHCKQFNTFSTPGWMDNCATFADVHEGIGKMMAGFQKAITKC